MVIKQIEGISESTLEKIKATSAYSLPINPSERGLTPEQIKARFYKPILDQAYSVIAELGRVITAANAELEALDKLLSGEEISVDGEAKALESLIILHERGGKSLKEYLDFIERQLGSAKEYANAASLSQKEAAESASKAETENELAGIAREDAENAAAHAKDARVDAEAARDKILNLKVVTTVLAEDKEPYVEKSEVGGVVQMAFHLPMGKPFRIAKTYGSVDEMNDGYPSDGVALGEFVIIASGVEDETNARLYVKLETGYTFIADLSGFTGEKGDSGYTPRREVDYMTPADLEYFDAHIDERLGEIEDSLNAILTIQESLIGGEAV